MKVRERRVKGKGRNDAGRGTWSGHAQQDFGKEGKCGNIGKYVIRKCRRKMKYMGEKSFQGCEEVRWRRALERACSTEFWKGKCGTKRKVRGIEESAGGKRSTGMWNETQEKQQWLPEK